MCVTEQLETLQEIRSTAEQLLEALRNEAPLGATTCAIEDTLLQLIRKYHRQCDGAGAGTSAGWP